MLGCCVPGCSSGQDTRSNLWKGKVAMYSFPTSYQDRKKWLDAIGIKTSQAQMTKSKVCSLHFMPKDLVRVHRVRAPMLRQGAVPKVFLDERLETTRPRNQLKVQNYDDSETEVPCCVFKGCHNDVIDLVSGVAFFRFPEVKGEIDHWASTLGHPAGWNPPSLARLCSQHFDPLFSIGGSSSDSKPLGQHLQDSPTLTEDRIKLVHPQQNNDFWKNIKEYYDQGLHCDLKIVCLSNEESLEQATGAGIMCHKLVLASMLPMISAAILNASIGEELVLYLVDYDEASVRSAVSTLYGCLAQDKDMEELTDGEVGNAFTDLGVDWTRFKVMQTESGRLKSEHNYSHPDFNHEDEIWEQDDYGDISGASEIDDADWIKDEDKDSEEIFDNLKEKIPRSRKRKAKATEKFKNDSDEVNPKRKKRKARAVEKPNQSSFGKMFKLSPENLDSVHDQLLNEQGVINVELVPEPFNVKEFSIRYRMMAMLGLQRTQDIDGSSHFNAIPLSVTPRTGDMTSAEDVKRYYNRFRPAAKAVFGLSQAETTGAPICWRMGLSRSGTNTVTKRKYEYRRAYINHSNEELMKLLTDEVVSANKTIQGKPKFQEGLFSIDESNLAKSSSLELRLNLVSEVPSYSDLEGIILAAYKESGEVLAYTLAVNDKSRKTDADNLLTIFFDVFTIQHRKGTPKQHNVAKVDSMIDESMLNCKLFALHSVVQDYLKGDRAAMKESLSGLGQKVCESCGQKFVLDNMNDIANYRQHRRKHFFDEYNCDCGLEFQNSNEKQSHVQLVHLKGYSQCEQCDFVGNKKCMKEHMVNRHKAFKCAECGEMLEGKIDFNYHIESACGYEGINPAGSKGSIVYAAKRKSFYAKYPCDCEMPFNNDGEKKRHVQLVHMKGYIECTDPECDRVMKEALLHEHMKRIHQDFVCEECGKDFKGTTAYGYHMRYEHNIIVAGDSVKKSNSIASSLYVNLSTFYPHPDTSAVLRKTEPCVDCGKTFDSPKLLYNHWLNSHRESKCMECDVKFVGDNKRLAHSRTVHKHFIDQLLCQECGKSFANLTSLRNHLKLIHVEYSCDEVNEGYQKEKEVFMCKHCNFSFLRKGSYVTHMRSHGVGEGCVHVCSDCGKTYNTPDTLKTHFNSIHREMECKQCGAKVMGYVGRNVHNSKFHPTEKDVKVDCPDCGKTLANDRQLRKHRYAKHIPESELPIPCPQCDRRFGTHSMLWTHKNRVHSTVRRFVCRYEGCTNDYKDHADRVGHEIKKHGKSFTRYQKELLEKT